MASGARQFVMRMSLSRVLAHPSLGRARPRVLTGAQALDRTVRWVHTSEVLDIAPLLHGGELLLTGGTSLAGAGEGEHRAYIAGLAARRVAGLAVETGAELLRVPAAVLDTAEEAGFPVVELRRTVPFVDVAEAVNGMLVNGSVARLRSAGDLSRDLSQTLAEGGGVQEVLDVVFRHLPLSAAVFDTGGRLLAAAPPGSDSPELPTAGPAAGGGAVEAHVTVRGVPAATLVFSPEPDADTDMLELACDRAVEALRLALLRSRPSTPADLAAGELVRLAAGEGTPASIVRLGTSAGFPADSPVVGVAVRAGGATGELARTERLLAGHGRTAVHMPSPDTLHALVSLPGHRCARTARARLLSELAGCNAAGQTSVALGPVLPRLAEAPATLSAAVECLSGLWHSGPPGGVADADELGVERMLLHGPVQEHAERLVREQLAPLLALPEPERGTLIATLEAYFESGCHKTRAAAALHLQRQSLYGRLQRVFELLGGDPTGTPRALPLHLALRFHRRLG